MHQKLYQLIMCLIFNAVLEIVGIEDDKIEIVDMTRHTNWKDMSDYYSAIEKRWKMCVNCGSPGLGTAMHLEHSSSVDTMYPAVIPADYLITRLVIVDVSSHTVHKDFVLTLEVALQWPVLKRDSGEPTLLLFKFGWKDEPNIHRIWSCPCKVPGISYELAEWISNNMTHVVGVATDAPTLESAQTREFTTRTVANQLGRNGIYMIDNVNVRKMPEESCMAISMPLKMLNTNYVPTRLTAFCPTVKTDKNVVVTFRDANIAQVNSSRIYDVNMDELLH